MFGLKFLKSPPTTHVIQYRDGQLVRQGVGLSFFYFAPTSVIVKVPVASQDVQFVFEETTQDMQEATIQGELTYRVSNAEKLSSLLNYSVDHRGRYESDDPAKLNDRLINTVQVLTRSFVQRIRLDKLLVDSESLIEHTLSQLAETETLTMLGVQVLGLTISSIKPTPEMAKALQADARERLLQKADEAIYARRNMAVELERQIKENELKTEIAVEHKKREVRETQLTADIALEQQRAEFVDQKIANESKESQARAEAISALLEPIKSVDWKNLLTAKSSLDSSDLIAMAFQDLAQNSSKIGNLNITPDLLSSLLKKEVQQDQRVEQ